MIRDDILLCHKSESVHGDSNKHPIISNKKEEMLKYVKHYFNSKRIKEAAIKLRSKPKRKHIKIEDFPISFRELTQIVSMQWQNLLPSVKLLFLSQAKAEREHYYQQKPTNRRRQQSQNGKVGVTPTKITESEHDLLTKANNQRNHKQFESIGNQFTQNCNRMHLSKLDPITSMTDNQISIKNIMNLKGNEYQVVNKQNSLLAYNNQVEVNGTSFLIDQLEDCSYGYEDRMDNCIYTSLDDDDDIDDDVDDYDYDRKASSIVSSDFSTNSHNDWYNTTLHHNQSSKMNINADPTNMIHQQSNNGIYKKSTIQQIMTKKLQQQQAMMKYHVIQHNIIKKLQQQHQMNPNPILHGSSNNNNCNNIGNKNNNDQSHVVSQQLHNNKWLHLMHKMQKFQQSSPQSRKMMMMLFIQKQQQERKQLFQQQLRNDDVVTSDPTAVNNLYIPNYQLHNETLNKSFPLFHRPQPCHTFQSAMEPYEEIEEVEDDSY